LEVVIVVAIIAILAAIGIPRMSRGAKGASDSALAGDLATLRNAIDLYATEHGGVFPQYPDPNKALTMYTDNTGRTNGLKVSPYIYGPYMRTIPPVPVGADKGSVKMAAAAATGVGWVYDAAEGKIYANTGDEHDEAGKLYTDY